MILESLIKDESVLTLDCAKARLRKGSIVDIADEYYDTAEVANAIKLGFIKVVGDPPPKTLAEHPDEKKVRLRNMWPNKLAFDSLRDSGNPYVDPGKFILIPMSKISHIEIQNAISSGMLEDVDGVLCQKGGGHGPAVDLEELTVGDIVEKQTIQKRSRPKVASAAKAKPIKSSHADEDGDEPNDVTSESKIIDNNKPVKKQKAVVEELETEPQPEEPERASPFSYLDIFDASEPSEGSF